MGTSLHRIGFYGNSQHPWPSVARAQRFFLDALSSRFEVSHLEPDYLSSAANRRTPKVIVNFANHAGWEIAGGTESSLMFAILGGAVVNRDFLIERLSKLRSSDCLIVNCTSDVEIIREMCESITPTICVLRLPIDLATFRPRPQVECRHFALCDEFDYVIGFVARLLPQKNLHAFLRELSSLRKAMAPAKVGGIIVGNYWIDYPCLPYETAIYPERIRELIEALELSSSIRYFPASMSDLDLAHCYGAMDVLYHPTISVDENFGFVPLEAMASGVPVVGSAYGGLKDSLIDSSTGILMPTWSTPSGIRVDLLRGHLGILSILKSAKRREEMAISAIQHVERNYSFEHCCQALCSAVDAALNSPISSKFVVSTGGEIHRSGQSPLPEVDPPWEAFLPSVRHYVSRPCPSLTECSLVRCAAPLLRIGNGTYRLADPAWPAQFELTDEDATILGYLEDWHAPSNLLQEKFCERSKLESWLSSGLLIGSDSKT